MAVLNSSSSVLQSFLWGSDLSGSAQGAGGVGGLLGVTDSTLGTHFGAFDGNGNVAGLVKASDGAISANYEYGPFGEIVKSSGIMAKPNPIRFSTKYQDDETDLLYYGYRYYNSSTGRWLSRDPMSEPHAGGLHTIAANNPINKFDVLGLFGTSDHDLLTTSSFFGAVRSWHNGVAFVDKVLSLLVRYNREQDLIYLPINKRHYNRDFVENESDYWRDQNRWAAVAAYQDYVAWEERNFYSDLRDGILFGWPKHDCKGALHALGHLSHSWQDFYGHGIHSQGGWESGGFIFDSPDMITEFMPSSYALPIIGPDGAEHPKAHEPLFSDAEHNLRLMEAEQYVQGRFENMLSDWEKVCGCECSGL